MVSLWLDGYGRDNGGFEHVHITGVSTNHGPQVYRVLIAQAQQQLPLTSHPYTVATFTKIVRVWGNKANPAVATGYSVIP